MRNTNRQARRSSLCIHAPRPEPGGLTISTRRLALTADDADLVEVAARIADELVLSPEALELLVPTPRCD